MDVFGGALVVMVLFGWLYYGARRSLERRHKSIDTTPDDLRRADDDGRPEPSTSWMYPS